METLLFLTFSGSALSLLLLVLRYRVLKKMPSTVYYYAWLLVLLRFVLPLPGLVPTFSGGADPAPSAVSASYTEPRSAGPETDPVLTAPRISNAQRNAALSRPENPSQKQDESTVPAVRQTTAVNWRSPMLWLGIWAVGVAVTLGLTVFSYFRFIHRLRRNLQKPDAAVHALYHALPGRKPALYSCSSLKTPLMCGLIRPCIILPASLYEEKTLTNILRHELMHYRRRDTLYKWFSVVVLSLHWFNPLAWLLRREISRACELSCDEMLLRSMNRAEKQFYGNTLLNMAAVSPLPAGVVATTFSTEKKNLKERLEQIMNYKRSGARALAAVLALMLLAGCGIAAGPAAAVITTSAPEGSDAVQVATVDELLAAIRPNTTILLKAGVYDLSTASNYGEKSDSPYYTWENVWGEDDRTHAELVISGIDGLTLLGEGMDQTTVAAVPRYANVLRFHGCRNLSVKNLTAGHTTEPGFCSGGVLRFENCTDVLVSSCGLYGCGTVGVDASDTVSLRVTGCHIYECSYEAVYLHSCRDVRVEGCEIDRHGTREGLGPGVALFSADYSDSVVIHNNRVYQNASQFLLKLSYTKNAAFLSNDVHDNRFAANVFLFEQYGATVDGCAFRDNGTIRAWVQSSGVYANDVTGKLLDASDFEAMTLRDIDPDVAVTPAPVAAAAEVRPGGSIEVTTVDEFLAAIGPDRTVILDGDLFDLSTASNYGSVGGQYYYWGSSYDGPELVIHNVSGLSIQAKTDDPKVTTLAAIPRYANVLSFRECDSIQLADFTAGHTKEPGSCSGGVLDFQNCGDIRLDRMRLYGCGILGIQASDCYSFDILRTEIFECSQGAGQFFQCDGIRFDACDVHDVPSPAFVFNQCGDKTWNSKPVLGLDSMYDVEESGTLTEYAYPQEEGFEYYGAAEDLANPFAAELSFHYQEGTPQSIFVAAVQKAFVDGDWEALADRTSFPFQFFADGYSFPIQTREDFMDLVSGEYFTDEAFSDAFRQRIADASLAEFGRCIFGNTCLDHLIAFSCFGTQVSEDNLYITAISIATPLWPGRSMAG